MAEFALRLRAAGKRFRQGVRVVDALRDVDLDVAAGRVTGVFGPDGAGKTTLMRLAAALLHPDAGGVEVLGADSVADAATIQASIGYMPQRFGLYEDLTVHENLRLYADLQGLDDAARESRFAELLRLTALGPFGARRAGALSGGMKQKLGLACVLLRAPRLLLLDEPTVGVDPISRRELWAIIKGMREQGASVLVSTAYLDEAEHCDDIVLLHEGRLLLREAAATVAAPLAGRSWLVRDARRSRRQLQLELQRRDGVLDALPQADGVRVVLGAGAPPRAAGERWDEVAPRFEDVFVSRLRDAGRAVATPPAASAPGADAPPAAAVIEVHGLRRRFGDFEAVRGIDFEVARGEVFGLLGANGAGKSTVFRMLCGLLAASGGSLRVAGVDLRVARAAARARIGYVAQRFALYANLSVAQNLAFFASAYGLRGARRQRQLDWALHAFELAEVADAGAGELAVGYKQRLALACALMHEPTILFLDEPTSGVDPLARREFWQRINALAESGVTVLVTTHFMDEAEYCDRVVLMSLGEILASGTPSEIRARAREDGAAEPSLEDAFIALIRQHEAVLRRAA